MYDYPMLMNSLVDIHFKIIHWMSFQFQFNSFNLMSSSEINFIKMIAIESLSIKCQIVKIFKMTNLKNETKLLLYDISGMNIDYHFVSNRFETVTFHDICSICFKFSYSMQEKKKIIFHKLFYKIHIPINKRVNVTARYIHPGAGGTKNSLKNSFVQLNLEY